MNYTNRYFYTSHNQNLATLFKLLITYWIKQASTQRKQYFVGTQEMPEHFLQYFMM